MNDHSSKRADPKCSGPANGDLQRSPPSVASVVAADSAIEGGRRRRRQDAQNEFRRTLRRTSRGKIVGRSPLLAGVLETIDRVAASDCTVVVTGETGTGKEAVVAALHDASRRAEGPLVTINCGALPAHLIESELFGHVRGAFTDALEASEGRVAEAEGGTLFLDEITELPLPLQVKMLRLLQNREFRPVGGDNIQHCDVRFVAATNRNLAEEVARGRFREDLYFRLEVVTIHLPPLRKRPEDLESLAQHFLLVAREAAGRSDLRGFSPEALRELREREWPGNVRELENVVFRTVLMGKGPVLDVADIRAQLIEQPMPAEIVHTLPADGIDLRAVVQAYQRSLVTQALERTRGNKKRAAQLLGLQRTTFLELVKRLNVPDRE